ncbi:hypothetical protein [Caviibacterium pharyngocola]|uniref:Uncharacterized protein n=1 Tax=Caviibacterium pharyngocola TaxID=28159 RepID=A0A2M8RUN2_9PAST|nr:hypothetical protein [Caviibacterium pharyngocola]PJG82603.1 hypothetical protein CVP04_08270 [Caviibacterium pharyngocola]
MKPFDLEKALAGNPLIDLHNNSKCVVKGFGSKLNCFVLEYAESIDGSYCTEAPLELLLKGECYAMWEEPRRFINGIEVPEPVTEETWVDGNYYWFVDLGEENIADSAVFFKSSDYDRRTVSRGLVFETAEGAEAMTKALLNYKVEIK